MRGSREVKKEGQKAGQKGDKGRKGARAKMGGYGVRGKRRKERKEDRIGGQKRKIGDNEPDEELRMRRRR